MSASVYAIVLPVVAAAMLYISIFVWRRQPAPGAKTFALLNALVIVWQAGEWIGRISQSFEGQLFGEKFKYLAVTTVPVGLLIFTFHYRGQAVPLRRILLLLLIPAISLLIIWTSPSHQLFWTSIEPGPAGALKVKYGLYFWALHTPYSYALVLLSSFLLSRELYHSPRFYRTQVVILITAICIPIISNFVYISGLTGGVSYTALSFAVFAVVLAWGLFHHQLLRSNPIAYEMVFRTIWDSVFVLDYNNVIADVNPTAAQFLGRNPDAIIGQPAKEIFAAWPDLFARFEQVQDAHEEITVRKADEVRHVDLRITPLHNRGGAMIGRVITARDITAAKAHQQMLENLAFRDTLTQLANRRLFLLEAERALLTAKENNSSLAILYFDLNKFKVVNDTWGHETGDQLLKYVASRVNSRLRRPDIFARLGGDEFTVLVQNASRASIKHVAERILQSVNRPFTVQGHTFDISLSLGIALYPEHGTELEELLRHADAAMYASKARGGGITFYESENNNPAGILASHHSA